MIAASTIFFALKRAYYFVIDNWRTLLPFVAVLIAVIVLISFVRSCSQPKTPKLNEAEIQRAEQAVRERNRLELETILTASDVREKQIDANVYAGRVETIQATQDAKRQYQSMTIDELQAEVDRRK